MKKFFYIFFLNLIIFIFSKVYAETILVESINLDNKTPTETNYFKGTQSKVLLISLPGGDGMSTQTGFGAAGRNHWHNKIFIDLTDANKSMGIFDFVLMSSPYHLGYGPTSQGSLLRASNDHMQRIENVILFYKNKTKLPIILMGHSRGGLSVMEFVNYVIKNNKNELLQGIIMSGANEGGNMWLKNLNIPTFFLHHKNDTCNITPFSEAERAHKKLSKKNESSTVLMVIEGGQNTGDGCNDNFHMFRGADEEVRTKLQLEFNKINFK